jgi:hypothetical protein
MTEKGEIKMNENQGGPNNLLDTTDCLEAVGVFKGWKNFLFIIIIICLLLLQICFWLINTGWVSVPPDAKMAIAGETPITVLSIMAKVEPEIGQDVNDAVKEMVPETKQPAAPKPPAESDQTAEPDKTAVPESPADPNQLAESNKPLLLAAVAPLDTNQPEESTNEAGQESPPSSDEKETSGFLFGIKFNHLAWLMRFVNAVLVLTAALYCLTLIFSLKVSMLGRLGGINHITRAFFLSLLALVLLLPWQRVFDGVAIGAMFTSNELVKWFSARTDDIFDITLYYLRFCGYWLLVLLLFVLAQIRSSHWAGAILRRLEVI